MDWNISISRQADKFLVHNHLPDDFLRDPLARAIKRFSGETVIVDLKRLSAEWEGFYRIRVGKIRIIFSVDMRKRSLFVEVVDYRGRVYKR